MDFNTVTLVGRMTHNPQSIHSDKTQVAKFSLAVNLRYGHKEETLFIDVVAFGNTAFNVMEYCNKGSRVLVSGRLRLEKWQQGDQVRQKHSVVAQWVVFLDPPNKQHTRNTCHTPAERQAEHPIYQDIYQDTTPTDEPPF